MVSSSRRRLLRALGGGAGAGLLGGLAGCGSPSGACKEATPEPASALPDEPGTLDVDDTRWPMLYRDAANTASVPPAGPTADVVRRWQADPDLGDPDETWVVAAGDRAFVGGRGGDVVAALDATDGSLLWRYDGLSDTGPLAVARETGQLVVADAGGLTALDVDGGERVWTTDGPALDAANVVLVADGAAYVAGRESVHAVDLASGEELWSSPGTHLGAVADGRVLVGEGLRALGAADGRERWAVEGPTPYGPVSVADGEVYVGDLGHVTAYGLSDGDRRWRYRGGSGEPFSLPAVAGDSVLAGTGRTEGGGGGNVYAAARADGTRRWCANLGFRDVRVAAGDGVAYLAAGTRLVARRVVDGVVIWAHETDERRYRQVAVAEGGLLAAAEGGRVDAFGER